MRRPFSTLGGRFVLPLISILASGALAFNLSADSRTTAPAAATAGSCTLTVPSKISITGNRDVPAVSLGADCAAAGVIDARWNTKSPDGALQHQFVSRFNKPALPWNLFDTDGLGVWTWQPAGATTGGDVTLAIQGSTASPGRTAAAEAISVPQNTPTTDIRFASEAYWNPANLTKPCVLNLPAGGLKHDINGDPASSVQWVPYAGARGSFQQLQRGSTTWTSISGATLPSTGKLEINIPWPKVTTHYRFVLYDAPTIWGSISNLYTWDPSPGC
ncbi:hypothetical protein EV651_12864 [Kribbella sp. VKM Ac-2571]|nr:hypothetical protein EV651_12864 [Kribbella sp. VKM Ac-2571]